MHRNSKKWLSSNNVTKPKLIKSLSVDDYASCAIFFFWKKVTNPVERAESFDIQLRYEKQLKKVGLYIT